MLASKSSMLSSKGNMLSCMILFAIEVDACVQLLTHILHHAVSRCTRARLHALVHYFTRDLNLMLADITRQAFIKYLLAILIHKQLSTYKHEYHVTNIQDISRKLASHHFKNPTSSWKVQVTLPLSFCHVLKCPKDIESGMLIVVV